MATPGFKQRVETTVAMALGASVAPDTAVTPITRIKMTNRLGWAIACEIKSKKESAITSLM